MCNRSRGCSFSNISLHWMGANTKPRGCTIWQFYKYAALNLILLGRCCFAILHTHTHYRSPCRFSQIVIMIGWAQLSEVRWGILCRVVPDLLCWPFSPKLMWNELWWKSGLKPYIGEWQTDRQTRCTSSVTAACIRHTTRITKYKIAKRILFTITYLPLTYTRHNFLANYCKTTGQINCSFSNGLQQTLVAVTVFNWQQVMLVFYGCCAPGNTLDDSHCHLTDWKNQSHESKLNCIWIVFILAQICILYVLHFIFPHTLYLATL